MPNLLMLPGRSNPDPRWRMWVQRLRTNSEAALKAVKAKNGDMISAAGDKVYETCEGCHMIFLPENQASAALFRHAGYQPADGNWLVQRA